MKHIITHFLKKQNPKFFLLRFGLCYSGILALTTILLLRAESQFFSAQYQNAEFLLVCAITAFLQTLIGYGFLCFCMKKDKS